MVNVANVIDASLACSSGVVFKCMIDHATYLIPGCLFAVFLREIGLTAVAADFMCHPIFFCCMQCRLNGQLFDGDPELLSKTLYIFLFNFH